MESISLARGVPAPECLALEELADCARAAIERDGATVLNYGPAGGYGPLREWIADRHRATIEIASEPGKGTTAIVRLPLATTDVRSPD